MTFWGTLAGGLVGTVVLTSGLRIAQELGVTRMDLPLLLGTAFTDNRSRANVIGYAVHFVNGLLFAVVYYAVFRAIEGVLDSFAAELVKSIKFFQTRYPNTSVSGTLLSGYGAVVPKLGDYVSAKTGIPSQIANPWQKVRVQQSDQQQLGTIATEFATVVGLAQRGNK